MTDSSPQTPPAQLFADDELLAFTSVPMDRRRSNGWTPAQQERFIRALDVMGSVGQAAKAVGMSRQSAYNLRDRPVERFDAKPLRCDFSVTFRQAQDRPLTIFWSPAW